MILTPQVSEKAKPWANLVGYNCVKLLLCAYDGQYMMVLKVFVYVKYGCEKQFEVFVSLNHDVRT
jgi:hypothetical protein